MAEGELRLRPGAAPVGHRAADRGPAGRDAAAEHCRASRRWSPPRRPGWRRRPPGRPFVDFSARRDHGADAAVLAARAAYVGGAAGTSMVEAGRRYGIPLSGTMAHSYVMAHRSEREAFAAFLRRYGERRGAADRHVRHGAGRP